MLYLGRGEFRLPQQRLPDHVLSLITAYLGKGGNVTTDNCFNSIKMARKMKKKCCLCSVFIVRTANKPRREFPQSAQNSQASLYVTKVFTNEA